MGQGWGYYRWPTSERPHCRLMSWLPNRANDKLGQLRPEKFVWLVIVLR